MATEAQTNANRMNAQKSSGPTSEEGKARSRQNALKHGAYVIEAEIVGIDPQTFHDREQSYYDHFQPTTPTEIFYVKAMIAAENEHDLCVALRPYTVKAVLANHPADSENPVGDAVVEDSKKTNALEKLARRTKAAYSIWVRSEKALLRVQTAKKQAEVFTAQAGATAPPDMSHPSEPDSDNEAARE